MHHKRKRPKDRRAGCKLCKPHKSNSQKDREEAQTLQERKACEDEEAQRRNSEVMDQQYRLRFFFDPGSGVCLWAGDDETRLEFGYPIDLRHLPISDGLRVRLEALAARFDESIHWEDPGGEVRWSPGQCDQFNNDVEEALLLLQEELSDFGIVHDEFEDLKPNS